MEKLVIFIFLYFNAYAANAYAHKFIPKITNIQGTHNCTHSSTDEGDDGYACFEDKTENPVFFVLKKDKLYKSQEDTWILVPDNVYKKNYRSVDGRKQRIASNGTFLYWADTPSQQEPHKKYLRQAIAALRRAYEETENSKQIRSAAIQEARDSHPLSEKNQAKYLQHTSHNVHPASAFRPSHSRTVAVDGILKIHRQATMHRPHQQAQWGTRLTQTMATPAWNQAPTTAAALPRSRSSKINDSAYATPTTSHSREENTFPKDGWINLFDDPRYAPEPQVTPAT